MMSFPLTLKFPFPDIQSSYTPRQFPFLNQMKCEAENCADPKNNNDFRDHRYNVPHSGKRYKDEIKFMTMNWILCLSKLKGKHQEKCQEECLNSGGKKSPLKSVTALWRAGFSAALQTTVTTASNDIQSCRMNFGIYTLNKGQFLAIWQLEDEKLYLAGGFPSHCPAPYLLWWALRLPLHPPSAAAQQCVRVYQVPPSVCLKAETQLDRRLCPTQPQTPQPLAGLPLSSVIPHSDVPRGDFPEGSWHWVLCPGAAAGSGARLREGCAGPLSGLRAVLWHSTQTVAVLRLNPLRFEH